MRYLFLLFFVFVFIILIWIIKTLIIPVLIIGLVFYLIGKFLIKTPEDKPFNSYTQRSQSQPKNDNVIDVEYQEKYED